MEPPVPCICPPACSYALPAACCTPASPPLPPLIATPHPPPITSNVAVDEYENFPEDDEPVVTGITVANGSNGAARQQQQRQGPASGAANDRTDFLHGVAMRTSAGPPSSAQRLQSLQYGATPQVGQGKVDSVFGRPHLVRWACPCRHADAAHTQPLRVHASCSLCVGAWGLGLGTLLVGRAMCFARAAVGQGACMCRCSCRHMHACVHAHSPFGPSHHQLSKAALRQASDSSDTHSTAEHLQCKHCYLAARSSRYVPLCRR